MADDELGPQTSIADDELFYRRVTPGRNCYFPEAGVLRISAQAFADRTFKPSVDRKMLCSGPEATQVAPGNGVVGVVARGIRSTTVDTHDAKGRPIAKHRANVHSDPRNFDEERGGPNLAHCEIRLDPNCENRSAFRRLLESLAQMATWVLLPPD